MSDKSFSDGQLSPTDAFQPTDTHELVPNAQGHLSITSGSVIDGRYRIVRLIGEGGMGSVWEAEQFAPVKRRVAVKFIKHGLVTQSTLARFHSERQALAIMDHPNVARFVDGGDTESSVPFVVMDYIEGAPITRFSDNEQLSIEKRIDLFLEVCEAVQHAHDRGVVHRDLKPSNILVISSPRGPKPKIVDFGLAKAIDASSPLSETADVTMMDRVVGTPLYMAPEQIDREFGPVDERTDVYGLGCVLYELLCGVTVLESSVVRKASLLETQKLICQGAFESPVLKVKSASNAEDIANNRGTTLAGLEKNLKGDLESIVMKAISKQKSERYACADEFAADLRRFKDGIPVHANSSSLLVRARKWIIRHRFQIILAELVGVLFVIGMAFTNWRTNQQKQLHSSTLLYFAIDAYNDARFDDATELANQCVRVRESIQPDNWTTFNAKSYLGLFQASTEQRNDAEENLIRGFDGMLQRIDQIPQDVRSRRMQAAIKRIVEFYRKSEQNEKADQWEDRLKEFQASQPLNTVKPDDHSPLRRSIQ